MLFEQYRQVGVVVQIQAQAHVVVADQDLLREPALFAMSLPGVAGGPPGERGGRSGRNGHEDCEQRERAANDLLAGVAELRGSASPDIDCPHQRRCGDEPQATDRSKRSEPQRLRLALWRLEDLARALAQEPGASEMRAEDQADASGSRVSVLIHAWWPCEPSTVGTATISPPPHTHGSRSYPAPI